MEDFHAQYIANAQERERQFQMATQNAGMFKKFTAETAAFLSDPVNDLTMFIPVAGQARVAGALGLSAETMLGRAATRAITFGTQGAVSQAPLSAIKYGVSQAEHTDYSIADAMRDTLFGGAVGAVAGPLFGGLKDALVGNPKWADELASLKGMKYPENEAIAKVAMNQMMKENPINVEPIVPKGTAKEYAISNAINSEEPVNVKVIGDENKGYAIIDSRGGQPIDITAMKKAGMSDEEAIAINLGDHEQGAKPDTSKVSKIEQERQIEQPITSPEEIKNYIQSNHENGVMGIARKEIDNTISDSHAIEPTSDIHKETMRYQTQADEMEAALREKADLQAMEEHDNWKKQQEITNGAYDSLKKCLLS